MNEFLILGGNSKLAQCFKKLFPEKSLLLTKSQCDLTKPQIVEKKIKSFPHEYILNCAAITDIELCEKDPSLCFKVNSTSLFDLDRICLKYSKKLINISSDYAVKPTNIYGWSKYFSEKFVSPRNLVIRTSFYCKESFLINPLLRGKETNVYKNRFFNPISINRLAIEIFKHRNLQGIKNFVSLKKMSFYSFSENFCKIFSLNKNLLKPVIYKNTKDKAFRPLSSYIKSDIRVDIKRDIMDFKLYLQKYDN